VVLDLSDQSVQLDQPEHPVPLVLEDRTDHPDHLEFLVLPVVMEHLVHPSSDVPLLFQSNPPHNVSNPFTSKQFLFTVQPEFPVMVYPQFQLSVKRYC